MLLMFDISVFHLSLSRNYIVFEVNDEVLEMCSFKIHRDAEYFEQESMRFPNNFKL